MKIILYEIKKSWFKLPILVLLIIFCIINVYKINSVYNKFGRFYGNNVAGIKSAYYTFYENYSGEITNEKIKSANDNFNQLAKLSKSENNGADYDKYSNSGTIYADYSIFQSYTIPELEYAVTYPNKSIQICQNAYENVGFYLEHKNFADAEKNKYIYKLYQNREIKNYNLSEWVKIYFEYDFSSLLIIIMIIIGLAPSFSTEVESGMLAHLKSSGKLKRAINAKLISMAIYIFLLTVFFAIFDLLTVKNICGVDGIFNPIYSAKFFGNSPFSFSLFAAVAVCSLGKFFAFFVFGEIVILISTVSKNSILSLCLCFLAAVIFIVTANESSTIANPVNMLLVYKMLKNFNCVIILGKPILSLYIALIFYFIIICVLALIIKMCVLGIKGRNLCDKTGA